MAQALPPERRRGLAWQQAQAVKKEWQAAWLVNAIRCIDLTTLAGDDTRNVCDGSAPRRASRLAPHIIAGLGLGGYHLATGAVCVYPTMVGHAVRALEGTGIPVASVATGFPAGLMPLKLRLGEEIRYAVDEGAAEIDIVITREAMP